MARRVHKARKQLVEHGVILPAPRTLHHAATALGRLRRVRPRLGVDQCEFGDPVRRLAHDLEGDVAAHGMAGEHKARRPLGEDAPGDRPYAVVADVVGDRHRPEPPQRRHDGRENPGRGDEARDQEDRHRVVHGRSSGWATFGRKSAESIENLLFEHDLFRKPASTFRHHARSWNFRLRPRNCLSNMRKSRVNPPASALTGGARPSM